MYASCLRLASNKVSHEPQDPRRDGPPACLAAAARTSPPSGARRVNDAEDQLRRAPGVRMGGGSPGDAAAATCRVAAQVCSQPCMAAPWTYARSFALSGASLDRLPGGSRRTKIQDADMFYFALPGIRDIRGSVTGDNAGPKANTSPRRIAGTRVAGLSRRATSPLADGPNGSTWLITGCGRPGRCGRPSGARSRRRRRAGRRALPPARRGSRTRLLCRLRAGRAAAAAPRARVPARS